AGGALAAGAISQRVARAERAGYVTRATASGTRAVDVTLTTAGHDLVEHLVDQVLGREYALVSSLEPAEREQLTELLRRLLDGLEDELGRPNHTQVGST